jgi:RNA polymerase sigma-70 factor (ECF subfamily)
VTNADTLIDVASLDQLALAARDGDRNALEQFVARTQADVWRFCAQMMGREHADDLTQDTFIRAIGSMHRFRGESSARTWLLTVARNTCVDSIRRNTTRRGLIERLTRQASIEAEVVAPSHDVELDELVQRLPADRRIAFVATQVLGLSYEETAEIAGVPIGTIRSRVARARADLMAAMAGSDRIADAHG